MVLAIVPTAKAILAHILKQYISHFWNIHCTFMLPYLRSFHTYIASYVTVSSPIRLFVGICHIIGILWCFLVIGIFVVSHDRSRAALIKTRRKMNSIVSAD